MLVQVDFDCVSVFSEGNSIAIKVAHEDISLSVIGNFNVITILSNRRVVIVGAVSEFYFVSVVFGVNAVKNYLPAFETHNKMCCAIIKDEVIKVLNENFIGTSIKARDEVFSFVVGIVVQNDCSTFETRATQIFISEINLILAAICVYIIASPRENRIVTAT